MLHRLENKQWITIEDIRGIRVARNKDSSDPEKEAVVIIRLANAGATCVSFYDLEEAQDYADELGDLYEKVTKQPFSE